MADSYLQRREQMFPKLTPALVAVVEHYGERRRLARDEIVFEVGDRNPDFMVVVSGRLQIEQPRDGGIDSIVVHEFNEFTGEVVMFSDRQSLVRGRALEPTEVIRVPHAVFQRMVGSHAELGEILMRAFILRRVGLIEQGQSDVTLIGSSHSADTLRLRSFLSRNGYPHRYLDVERDEAADAMLDRFAITAKDIPIVLCGARMQRNPSNRELADCLGISSVLEPDEVVDVAVIGAGPAGLAAAVYGASEGLHVVVVEGDAPGGQAGTSSKIENYLGFPTGISGQALAARALTQAEKFGARMLVPRRAIGLTCLCQPYQIALDDGTTLRARSIVIASGARYRKLDVSGFARFEGRGIYYGATSIEARMCGGDEVVVVGGGNSAGQAAVFLAQHARHVHILVRREGLAATMSRYLIDRIESSDRITLHPYAEVIGLGGDESLAHQRWRVGERELDQPIKHIFVMIGAAPNSEWLQGCVQLDRHGFVCTGPLAERDWPLERPRHLLETNRPRIFAVGDIRADSVKRVASAVGEGSMCIRFVHEVLDDAH
ncbi:FAD-dependent oxidoreductase [Nannocystaceae bacterium ST9]